MLKTIFVHGDLGDRYGHEHHLDVVTPGEALRAIDANFNGFLKELYELAQKGVGFRVQLGERDMEEIELFGPFSASLPFHITPVITGAGNNNGGIKVVIGMIIIVAAIAASPYTGGGSNAAIPAGEAMAFGTAMAQPAFAGLSYMNIAMIGASVMLGGISQLLSPTPSGATASESEENRASYMFNGPVNTMVQGGPVPLGYGHLLVGSYTISAALEIKNIPIGTMIQSASQYIDYSCAVTAGEYFGVSCKVRLSTIKDEEAYNGSMPEVWVRKNEAVGIMADTFINYVGLNAPLGVWIEFRRDVADAVGGSCVPTAEGTMTFYIKTNQTTGFISIDDWCKYVGLNLYERMMAEQASQGGQGGA